LLQEARQILLRAKRCAGFSRRKGNISRNAGGLRGSVPRHTASHRRGICKLADRRRPRGIQVANASHARSSADTLQAKMKMNHEVRPGRARRTEEHMANSFSSLWASSLFVIALAPAVAQAQIASVTAGALQASSTIQSIGLEWRVLNDADHDAVATVDYRPSGSSACTRTSTSMETTSSTRQTTELSWTTGAQT
jgi:hypothetical protein